MNAGYSEDLFLYTNNIHQKDGNHLLGFRSALTRTPTNTPPPTQIYQNHLSGDDIKEGLTCVLSPKFDPKFSSQTKDKLVFQKLE